MKVTICKAQAIKYSKKYVPAIVSKHHRVTSVTESEVVRGWMPVYTGVFVTRKGGK